MSQWYLSKNGQALGPLKKEKLVALIQAGDVSHLDLVYQVGDEEWRPLSEVQELSQYLQADQPPAKKAATGDVEWVLLSKVKSEKGSEYKQLGPFSEEQVLELIDQGKVRFSDFAWKKGFESWVKIAELEPFAQPLPSSSNIDLSLYDKTSPDLLVENTVTDDHKASLTSMVKIERFDHKENEEKKEPATDKEELPSETAPINTLDFATQSASGITDSPSESDVNLWSLEPPETDAGEKTVVAPLPKEPVKMKKTGEHRRQETQTKERKKETVKKKAHKKTKVDFESEKFQWMAAAGVFLLAVAFLLLSLRPSPSEVVYLESEKKLETNNVAAQAPSKPDLTKAQARRDKAAFDIEAANRRMEALRKEMAAVRSQEFEAEVAPKVPLSDKISASTKRKVASAKKKSSKKKKKTAKKKKIKGKSKKIAKKKVKAKKVVKKKKVAKKKKAKVKPKKIAAKAAGSKKMQSYYKQRDRKALFYSSLKAETLAVEIQRNFKKLRKNKVAWKKYYTQWRKKVRSSLAKEIRNYPVRSQKYAYPKVLSAFKQDYNLFYKYGEAFNAQVNGSRTPSGAPKDMGKIFSRYKNQAKSLGR